MGLLRQKSTENIEIYIYEFLREHNYREVAHWLCRIVNFEIVKTEVITLRDTERRSDEGNLTIQFEPPLDEDKIVQEMSKRDLDRIEFDGLFRRAPILVSFNLRNYEIRIGIYKDHLIDIHYIEKEFGLNN